MARGHFDKAAFSG